MADMTTLRNQIVKNASVGTTPPHGPVKTGELPLVQVKAPPVGRPVQEGQQKPVAILPSKDPKGNVTTGALPLVQVKMGQNGPEIDDGRDNPVVIRDGKQTTSAGALPMVQIEMTKAGPQQLHNTPQQQSTPPQIPSAAPVLSVPRASAPAPRQGYVARPALPHTGQGYVARVALPVAGPPARELYASSPRVARIAAPQVIAPQVDLPPLPELSTEQLMLCRHRVDKYLGELVAATYPVEPPAEMPPPSEAVQLAKATIATLDDILVATAVRAEAAEKAAAAAAAAPIAATIPTVAVPAATASIAPTPSVSYVAGRVTGTRSVAGARAQRNAGMAPRRTARQGASPLPPVIVKMDGQRAVVQNQAEIAEAKAALEAQSAPEVVAPEAADGTDGGASQG